MPTRAAQPSTPRHRRAPHIQYLKNIVIQLETALVSRAPLSRISNHTWLKSSSRNPCV
ncbi:hypothetical protein X989_5382 [Burkholderia pseudomallei MSHR4378]|nr:hypothetical protein X989_5382 [Burkholderia pseudomallei MSHR4378]